MTFGDILVEPAVYGVLLFVLIGAFYAKGNFADALLMAIPAPIIIYPIWAAMHLVAIALLIPIQQFLPNFYDWIANQTTNWPPTVQFLVMPVNLLMIAAYAFFCHYERQNRDLPCGYSPATNRTHGVNPFSKSFRK